MKPATNFPDLIERLDRDLKEAAKTLSTQEARFLVDSYLEVQRQRIRLDNQAGHMAEAEEPTSVITWWGRQAETLETRIRQTLDAYSLSHPLGVWCRSITGIGPVVAAGMLALAKKDDLTSAGQLWRFAGLDPTSKWEKGKKRPWNASLKRICWLLGESFVKTQGKEDSYYGPIYVARRAYEDAKNLAGDYAPIAVARLEQAKARKQSVDAGLRKLFESGHLPDKAIYERCKRYTVKLFLSHFFEVNYILVNGKRPASPYVIEHMGHVRYMEPPGLSAVLESVKKPRLE